MIFTECPYCDEPQCFDWEYGDTNGFFPSKCSKCSEIMWVEGISLGGVTRPHDNFIIECVPKGDIEEVNRAAENAVVLNIYIK